MALPFDPEGFPVVNVLHSGGASTGGLGSAATLVADSSVAAENLAGAGGAWVSTTLDMANIPALAISAWWVWHAAAGTNWNNKLAVVWTDDSPWVLPGSASDPAKYELFGCSAGNGGVTPNDGKGGLALLLNRKRRYCTLLLANGDTDVLKTIDLTVNTYALGAPVEEFDSSRTNVISNNLSVIALTDNDIHSAGLSGGCRYLARVVGGEGICIRSDGNTVTIDGMPFFDGDVYGPFVATCATAGIQCIKRTAWTANASVIVVGIDNQ